MAKFRTLPNPPWQDLATFRAYHWPAAENIIDPWLPVGGLGMIFAGRGVGKTFLALHVAAAVAGAWQLPEIDTRVPRARRVLYVDGEMQPGQMQRRFDQLFARRVPPPPANFHILNHAALPDGITLSTEGDGRAIVEHAIEATAAEFVVLDNFACLFAGLDENSTEAWASPNRWLLGLRRRDITVLGVHHAGKSGMQRGASAREDAMDTVVHVTKVTPDRPTPLRWSYSKFRSFTPEPLGGTVFEMRFSEDSAEILLEAIADPGPQPPSWFAQAAELKEKGASLRTIAEVVGTNKDSVHRTLRAFGPAAT